MSSVFLTSRKTFM